MKFRVSSKDIVMFGIFAVFLLYLCAVLTTNINYFSENAAFYGLNPIPGLTKFLGATLVLFVIFLVLIMTSVSSLIFERKKGIGFEIGEKDNKGYSRWAKEKEMKGDKGVEVVDPLTKESEFAGIPLVNDGKKLWVDNGEYHNLVIGATGSGKSQTVVEPMVELLIKHGESMIITDPKGELYRAASNYMRERGYNVIVLNFREPQMGNAWNPLTLPFKYYKNGDEDKAVELLNDVALNILYDPKNKSGDPFWEKSSADYFSGLALGLFEDTEEEKVNLNSISFMSTVGEEKFAASNYIKEYFTMKGEASTAYGFASNTINSPTETKGGILSVFRQKIRQFATQKNLSEMLSYSDFDMTNIGKEKTAVFIIIHDEKTTYHGLATIFIKQCYETLIDVAQQNGGKLPFRTNFILDEFANMPPLRDVTTMVTAARSRKIRFTFIIQNFAQLKSVYGNEDAETIKGNCGNLVYLISTELAALEEISKMCGEVKSSDKEKTSSTPLVTVTDLQKLKLFEAIIIRWRLSPFKTKYTPNFKMNWGHEHIEADFQSRKVRDVQLFDIKEFVKEKKRQNMLNSLDNNAGGSTPGMPPMGGAGANPFGGGANPSNPFGGSSNSSNPFGRSSSNPFAGTGVAGAGANPFGGAGANPFGGNSNPTNPFGGNSNPTNPFGGGANPFGSPSGSSDGMFGGSGSSDSFMGGIDLDAMMRDIDKKIAELDAEEARQKEEEAKKKEEASKQAAVSEVKTEEKIDDIPKLDSLPKLEMPVSEPKLDVTIDEPKLEAAESTSKGLIAKFDDDIDKLDNTMEMKVNEPVIKDVEPVKEEVKVQETIQPVQEKKVEQLQTSFTPTETLETVKKEEIKPSVGKTNLEYDTLLDTNLNIFEAPIATNSSANEISIGNEKANIAIATSSPAEEFVFDDLPKAQNADVLKPNYQSGTSVKTSNQEFNIYNTMPDIMGGIKEEVKTSDQVKEEVKDFVDTLPRIEIPKDKLSDAMVKLNDMENNQSISKPVVPSTPQVQTQVLKEEVEKTNVNIKADEVVIDNNVISDDEFFDDFFGDD